MGTSNDRVQVSIAIMRDGTITVALIHFRRIHGTLTASVLDVFTADDMADAIDIMQQATSFLDLLHIDNAVHIQAEENIRKATVIRLPTPTLLVPGKYTH